MSIKVLLIKPPLPGVRVINPSLGLAYLAAVLERTGYLVKIIDAPALGYLEKEILAQAKEFKPTIIGLTSTTPEFPLTLKLAKDLKKNLPDSLIILGGSHVTASPKETMVYQCFDLAVIGEGEETLLELVRTIEKNQRNFQEIKGLALRKRRKVILTPPRPFIADLDTLPFPAWHLLPRLKNYQPSPGSYKNLPIGTIITSRGCPFHCTFCARSVFGNQWRFRSPRNVAREIEILIKEYGAREIRIWDDTFNLNQERVNQICQEILKRKLKFSWTCLGRVNFTNFKMLKLMKKAGCWQISYGIESGSQEILNKINKGITLKMAEEAIRRTKKVGLEAKCFFMLGLPGETEKTIEATIEFAKKLDPDIVTFSITTPFPGTEIYQEALKTSEFRKIPFNHYLPYRTKRLAFVPQGLSAKKIFNYQRKAYRQFYLRPKVFRRELGKIRNFTILKNKIQGFIDLIFSVSKQKFPPDN